MQVTQTQLLLINTSGEYAGRWNMRKARTNNTRKGRNYSGAAGTTGTMEWKTTRLSVSCSSLHLDSILSHESWVFTRWQEILCLQFLGTFLLKSVVLGKKQKLSILILNIPEKEANWPTLIRFLLTPISYDWGYGSAWVMSHHGTKSWNYICTWKLHQEGGHAVPLVANYHITFY